MSSLAAYARLVSGNRNFRRLWMAQIVSEIGDWFYALAIYSLILELTGKAELVALAVILQVLPTTFISPTAGVVNDRISRKRVMIAADLMRFVVVLGMLFVRTREMVWLVYPLLFFETIGWGFFEPGRSAVIPNITREGELLTANTLSSTTWSFNLAIGSTLGGAIAAWLGRDAVFIINALSFLVSAWLLRGMRFDEPHAEGKPLRWRDLVDFSPVLEGFRYVRRDPRLVSTVMCKGGLGLLGANLVVLPLMGERVFPLQVAGIDQQRAAMLGMSLLMGARGIGALVGPFVTGAWAANREPYLVRGILFGFFSAAAGYMLLSRAPVLALAVAAVVFTHAAGSTIWVFSTTLLQAQTEDRFRGRVFAAELGINMLSISVASFCAGRIIDAGLPVRTAALVTGCTLLIPGFVWAWAMRFWRTPAPLAPPSPYSSES